MQQLKWGLNNMHVEKKNKPFALITIKINSNSSMVLSKDQTGFLIFAVLPYLGENPQANETGLSLNQQTIPTHCNSFHGWTSQMYLHYCQQTQDDLSPYF